MTNFAAVRYRDNGGLFPQSPAKLGMNTEVTTSKVWENPDMAHSQRSLSQLRTAKPSLELGIEHRQATVLQPRKILRDVDESRKLFKKYSTFKQ